MHCLKGALIVVMALGAMLVSVQRAAAMTAEGTLLTNVACGTYSSMTTVPYEVSYCATATVLVAFPVVQVSKTSSPSVACSGATVTFCISAVNNSLYTSAFNVMLRDYIDGFVPYTYVSPSYTEWRSDPGNTNIAMWWGPFPLFPTVTVGEPPDGQIGPIAVRWVMDVLGPGQSVYICFSVLIL